MDIMQLSQLQIVSSAKLKNVDLNNNNSNKMSHVPKNHVFFMNLSAPFPFHISTAG